MSLAPRASAPQLVASDPAVTAWVNANAGSGKTHVLVDRVIRLLLGGVDPARIMCLTFTKAAAAEMANRLFERLSGWIALSDEDLVTALRALGTGAPDGQLLERARQLFTRALETPGGLKIQTIHAFCERVLQLFPVEAGVVPHFTMLDDRAAKELRQAARDSVLLRAQAEPQSALGLALHDVASLVQADAFDDLLGNLLSERANLAAILDTEDGLAVAEAMLRHHLNLRPDESQDTVHADLAIDRSDYDRLASLYATGTKTDGDRATSIRAALANRNCSLIDLKDLYLTRAGDHRKLGSMSTKGLLDRNDWLEPFLTAEQTRLVEGLGKLADLERIAATGNLLRIGAAIVAEYESAKRQMGAYDFDDLIIRTGELLSERPDAQWVLYKLDGGIEHLLVDEAQDTSPAQWEIIRSLTDEFFAGEGIHGRRHRTVFVVGDRKQSIYSFQGADPDVFETIHDEFEGRTCEAQEVFRDVDLTVSFRSTKEVLDVVDAVFRPGTPARSGLDGQSTRRDWNHESNRRDVPGVVELWPLTEPLDREPDDPWQAPVDREPAQSPRRRLAHELAQTIKSWIGRRTIVALNRAVAPQDILILVRSRDGFFDALIRALWSAGVPVAGADRLKLGENIAVLDLLALAQFCIMPEDDHALAAILKSPLFADPLSEDDLLAIAAERGTQSLWSRLRASGNPRCRAAAELLEPLIRGAPAARPFEFFSAVLGLSRGRFLARLGSEANDAIDAFLETALGFEESHATSLAGFVNWFAASEIEIRRNMEQAAGEVRIMTVHGAKGLEAPIVILPDTVSVPDHRNTSALLMLPAGSANAKVPLWLAPKLFNSQPLQYLKLTRQASQTDEHRRLLYVAMTRARDELYVCGYAGKRAASSDCWYETVSQGLQDIAGFDGMRFGVGPVFGAGAEPAASPSSSLPDWVLRPIAARPPRAPKPEAPPEPRQAARVARGILVHRILQQVTDLPESARPAHVADAVARAGHEPSLAVDLVALIRNPTFSEVFASDGLSEVPLIVEVPDAGPERRRIDRLVMTEHDLLVVDYKTDRNWPHDVAGINPEYLQQLAAYRAALRRIHPGVPLRLALLWTEAPALMIVPDAELDRAV